MRRAGSGCAEWSCSSRWRSSSACNGFATSASAPPSLKFIADFGFGALAFFGAALAIVATAQLFFSEIEQRTALTLLPKPVWRAEFLLGKLGGVAALLAPFCGALTLLIAAILWSRETALMRQTPEAFAHGRTVDYFALVAAGFAQGLKLLVLAALTLLGATFARMQIFTAVTGFLILVVCHLQLLAQTAAGRGDSAGARLFAGVVALLFPDFQIFDLSDAMTMSGGIEAGRLVRLATYSAGYVAAVAVLASVSFRKREI